MHIDTSQTMSLLRDSETPTSKRPTEAESCSLSVLASGSRLWAHTLPNDATYSIRKILEYALIPKHNSLVKLGNSNFCSTFDFRLIVLDLYKPVRCTALRYRHYSGPCDLNADSVFIVGVEGKDDEHEDDEHDHAVHVHLRVKIMSLRVEVSHIKPTA